MSRAGIDRNICVAWENLPDYHGPFGYQPTLAVGIVFCALFATSTILHIFTSVWKRTWWQLVFAVGAITELIGWAGRTWSSKCPYENTPFLIQIVTLIIAPAFFSAGTYLILGRLIKTLGDNVSPIGPNVYLYIFCAADLISLIVQAIGGASAAAAYAKNPPTSTANGTHIMVAGIVFQLCSVLVFSALFTMVIMKALKTHNAVLTEGRVRALVAATSLSVICVIVRSIYRTIELVQGWTGFLITHEGYFIALDGVMMILAVGVFNFIQPRWAGWQGWEKGDESMISGEEMVDRTPVEK